MANMHSDVRFEALHMKNVVLSDARSYNIVTSLSKEVALSNLQGGRVEGSLT
jgi:hypothetical protein